MTSFCLFVANHSKLTLNAIIAQKELLKKIQISADPLSHFGCHVLSRSHFPNWLALMKPKQPQISAEAHPHINTYFSQCLKTAENTSVVPVWAYPNVNELLIIHLEIISLHNHYRVKNPYSVFYFGSSVFVCHPCLTLLIKQRHSSGKKRQKGTAAITFFTFVIFRKLDCQYIVHNLFYTQSVWFYHELYNVNCKQQFSIQHIQHALYFRLEARGYERAYEKITTDKQNTDSLKDKATLSLLFTFISQYL